MRSMDLLRGKNPNPFTNYVKKDCYICLVTIVAGQIIVYTEAYEIIELTNVKINIIGVKLEKYGSSFHKSPLFFSKDKHIIS